MLGWKKKIVCRALSIIALIVARPVLAVRENVALTFDDLPALTIIKSQDYVTYSNIMILRGLVRHNFPAIGFVNEGKFDLLERNKQIDVLRMWLKSGMNLGNHTFSHNSPNGEKAETYIADIERGEKVTKELLTAKGRKISWFRHPYLETGTPLADKEAINHWLNEHGYRIAPVTMENSDWMFSEPYDDAIARHNETEIKHIKQAYLDYTLKSIIWSKMAAHKLLGRNMSYVMLLHVTRLNADCIDDLAALLKQQNLHPVTLEKVMKDPAYALKDPYVGPDGVSWLERWALALHKDLDWETYTDPPEEIKNYYNRVDH